MTSVLYSSMMLGERVVERVADAADRRLDASRGKTLGALYTAKFPARTRWTSTRSSSSRFAREGSFSGASLRARNSR